MRTLFKFSIVFITIFLFTHCNKYTPENAVRCIATNFDDEIENNQNLTFTFNKELLQSDTLIGKWSPDHKSVEVFTRVGSIQDRKSVV